MVFCPGGPFPDATAEADAILVSKRGRLPAEGRIGRLGAEHDLHDAAAVPQVNEEDLPVVPQGVHPAGQPHLLICIGKAQSAAGGSIDLFHNIHPR